MNRSVDVVRKVMERRDFNFLSAQLQTPLSGYTPTAPDGV